MPLSPKASQYLAASKAQFLNLYGNTPANSSAFDQFVLVIASSAALTASLNDQIDSGYVRSIGIVDPASIALGKRAHYVPGLISYRGNSVAALRLNERAVAAGIVNFDPSTILSSNRSLQAFVIGHELAHAKYVQVHRDETYAVTSAALSYITSETARISALPVAQRRIANIDVTANVVKLVDDAMKEEGRANIAAFNALIADLNNQGIPFGATHLNLIAGTAYGTYLIDPVTGVLHAGLTVSPSGFLAETDANALAAARANQAVQARVTGPAAPTTHNVVYAAFQFGILLYHSSNTPLKIDISQLNLPPTVTFDQFLLESAKVFPVAGTWRVVDSTTGTVRTITVTRALGGGLNPPTVAAPQIGGSIPDAVENSDRLAEKGRETVLPDGIIPVFLNGRLSYLDKYKRPAEIIFDEQGQVSRLTISDSFDPDNGKYRIAVVNVDFR